MRKILFLISTLSCIFGLTNGIALAGPYTDEFTKCLVSSTTEKDKQKIVRWIVKVYSDHPSLSDISKISSKKNLMVDKDLGEVFTRLLAEKCRDKAIKAIELVGDMVLYTAFKTLGEVAGQQLLNDENVQNSLNEFTKYVDYEKLDYLNDWIFSWFQKWLDVKLMSFDIKTDIQK